MERRLREGSNIENRLKHKSVGGREANVKSIPTVLPSADHGIDKSANSMQLDTVPANGRELAQMIETGVELKVRVGCKKIPRARAEEGNWMWGT